MGNSLQRSTGRLAAEHGIDDSDEGGSEPLDLRMSSPGAGSSGAVASPPSKRSQQIKFQLADSDGKRVKLTRPYPSTLAELQQRLADKVKAERPDAVQLTHIRAGGVRAPIADALDYDVFLQRLKAATDKVVVEVGLSGPVLTSKKRKRSASSSPNGGELPGGASFDIGTKHKKQKTEKQMRKSKAGTGVNGSTPSSATSSSSSASTPQPVTPATPSLVLKSHIAAHRFKPAKSSPLARPVEYSDPLQEDDAPAAAAPLMSEAQTSSAAQMHVGKKAKSKTKKEPTNQLGEPSVKRAKSSSKSKLSKETVTSSPSKQAPPTQANTASAHFNNADRASGETFRYSSTQSASARAIKAKPKRKPGPSPAEVLAEWRAKHGVVGDVVPRPKADMPDGTAGTPSAAPAQVQPQPIKPSPPKTLFTPAATAAATPSTNTPKASKKKQKITALEAPVAPSLQAADESVLANSTGADELNSAAKAPRGRKRKAQEAAVEQITNAASEVAAPVLVRSAVPPAQDFAPSAPSEDDPDDETELDEDAEYSPIESDEEPASQRRSSRRRLFRRSSSSDAMMGADDDDDNSISAGSEASAGKSAITQFAPTIVPAESIEDEGDPSERNTGSVADITDADSTHSSRSPSRAASQYSQFDVRMPQPTATPPHNTGALAYIEATEMSDDDIGDSGDISKTSSRQASESLSRGAQTESPGSLRQNHADDPPSTPPGRGPSSQASTGSRKLALDDDIASQPTPTPKERPAKTLRVGIPARQLQHTVLASPLEPGEEELPAGQSAVDDGSPMVQIQSSSVLTPAVLNGIGIASAASEQDELASTDEAGPSPRTADTKNESRSLTSQPRHSDADGEAAAAIPYTNGKSGADEDTQPSAASDTPAFPSSIFGGRQVTKVKQNARQSARASCTLCDAIPQHLQKRCPIVIGGLSSIEQRLVELKRDEPGSPGVEALQAWREKLMRAERISTSSTKSSAAETQSAPGAAVNGSLHGKASSGTIDAESNQKAAKLSPQPAMQEEPVESAPETSIDSAIISSASNGDGVSAHKTTKTNGDSPILPGGEATQEEPSDPSDSSDAESESDSDATQHEEPLGNGLVPPSAMRTLSFPTIPSQTPSSRRSVISLSDLRPEDLKKRPARSVSSAAGSMSGRASASVAGSEANSGSDNDSSSSDASSSSMDSSDDEQAKKLDPEIQARYVNGKSKRRDSKAQGADKTW